MRSVMLAVSLLAALVPSMSAVDAQPRCKPIVGHFEAAVVPPPACTVAMPLVCTGGRVWGGLQGEYAFVMSTVQPADPTMPWINFFTGRSTITLKTGDTLQAVDTGTIDFQSGGFASLITITGGIGGHAGTTGQMRLIGIFDPQAGTTAGEYRGTLCRP